LELVDKNVARYQKRDNKNFENLRFLTASFVFIIMNPLIKVQRSFRRFEKCTSLSL